MCTSYNNKKCTGAYDRLLNPIMMLVESRDRLDLTEIV